MTQEEIRFNNMQGNRLGGWHNTYPFKSVGDTLNWLYVFGTFDIMETALVGEHDIIYRGNSILKIIEWNEKLCMPIFEVVDSKYKFIIDNQVLFIEESKKKKFVVLEHLTLPDRGFRFYSLNSENNSHSINGDLWYAPICYTNSDEEAQVYARQTNTSRVASFRELEQHFREEIDTRKIKDEKE